MNEVACQRAIRKLIRDNQDVLVSGMVQQGEQRAINDIVLSVATPPTGYYYILIQVTQKTGSSFDGSAQQSKPHRKAEYNCALHVVDPAIPSGDVGEEQYEVAHTYHRSLCDRIEALICGSYFPGGGAYATYFVGYPACIPDPDSNSVFKLMRARSNDRSVRVVNMDTNWTEPGSDTYTPIFYSTMSFTMLEEWVR